MGPGENSVCVRNKGFPAPRSVWGPAAVQCEAWSQAARISLLLPLLPPLPGSELTFHVHCPGSGSQLSPQLSVQVRTHTCTHAHTRAHRHTHTLPDPSISSPCSLFLEATASVQVTFNSLEKRQCRPPRPHTFARDGNENFNEGLFLIKVNKV